MRRFYFEGPLERESVVTLPAETAHHISSVLRLTSGSQIILFNGQGISAKAKLRLAQNDNLQAEITDIQRAQTKPSVKLILAQALLNSSKFSEVLQKCTELGVHSIIPFTCNRSVPYLKNDQLAKKAARWQKIIIEAARQSERDIPPPIEPLTRWADLLKHLNAPAQSSGNTLKLIAAARETRPLKNALRGAAGYDSLMLLIGPEGGFTEAELMQTADSGFIPISLSTNILRTETAGPAALAMIAYHLSKGDDDD